MSHIPFLVSRIPFPMRYILIPGENESQTNKRPHQERTSSPGMSMCFTGNGDVSSKFEDQKKNLEQRKMKVQQIEDPQ